MLSKKEIVQYRGMKPAVAEEVIEGLYEAGINFVSMLPESELLTAQMAILKDERFESVSVCNEASGICVCGGAWLGGKKPAMLMGSAGLSVSFYPLVSLCIRHGIPVLLLVGAREVGDENWIMSVWHAHTVKPSLHAMNFPYVEVKRLSDIREAIKDSAKTCFAWMKPVAVLLEGGLIFK